jgi:competence protein ComEC
MVALGTDHHAWLAAPVLDGWGGALPACTAIIVSLAMGCVACLPITRGVLFLVLVACASLGLVLGTSDARAWHACMVSLGSTHPDARTLVSLTATVVTAPEPARLADPIMEPLAADRRAVRFTLGSISGMDGAPWPDHATINARIAASHSDLAIGDRVVAKGWMSPMRPSTNPGGYDMSRWARSRFVLGSLFIESNELVTRVAHEPRPIERWKHHLVARLESIVADMAPEFAALCVAMTLGPTSPPMDDIASDCQVTGMTHVLALSGFNVGLLLALAGRVLALTPCRGVARAGVMVACAMLFLFSASAGISADRAAIAAMLASGMAGTARGVRAWHAASIVVIVVVVGAPSAMLDIGFQLSVIVAAALAAWASRAPQIANRWADRLLVHRSPRGPSGSSRSPGSPGSWHARLRSAVEAGLAALIVGSIACLASAPIVMHHFGSITPLVVPGSIVAAPLSACIVTLCTIALVVSAASSMVASWIVIPAAWCAAAFATLADGLAAWTGASWSVQPIHGWACGASLACLVMAMQRPRGSHRLGRRRPRSFAPVWFAPPLMALVWWAWPERFDLRVTILDVGNGSAWVVEHGDTVALVDGGSLDVPDVGARTIVPALRALGISGLTTISLSHADLDHLNGLPAVIERLPVDCFVTTPCVIEGACPGTPSGRALDAAWQAGCRVMGLEAQDALELDGGSWSVLHPHHGVAPFPRNESSLVWMIHARGGSLLLTGDIEEDGSRRVRAGIEGAIRKENALLMELPHHGSFRPGVASLIEHLKPAWIGQSTGPARLVRDRWAWIDASTSRSVTARDGAVRVTIRDGAMTVERWEHGWVADRGPTPD